MIKGIYTSASAMRTGIARQDITANNMANASTTGFKRDRLFVSELIQAGDNPMEKTLLEPVEASRFIEFTPGPLNPTGNDTDFAVQGNGFFEVTGEEGPLYTRNGRFQRNNEGKLVDTLGRAVQGDGGDITLPEGVVNVSSRGEISVNGTVVDKIKVVDFESPQQLKKAEGAAFANPDALAGESTLDNAVVRQGFLEASNVETMQEMVEMISTARNYELNARMLTTQDQTLQRTVNDIGRI
jgi:flagellar basal-body rod protein FlgF